jgi:hypothetical protein
MSIAAHTASPIMYVESDVPEGMTLREWRSNRHRRAAPTHHPVNNALRQARRTVAASLHLLLIP